MSRTFVVPFDHHSIHEIATHLDHVADLIDGTAGPAASRGTSRSIAGRIECVQAV